MNKDRITNKRIVMRMRGGLGNQLFILGYGIYLSEICDCATELICDTREYEKYKRRNYEVDSLCISDSIEVYNPCLDNNHVVYDLLIKILHVRLFINKHLRIKDSNRVFFERVFGIIYKEKPISLDSIKRRNVYLYGYFGDANHMLNIRNRLIDEFAIKEKNDCVVKYLDNIESASHSIAISMRLGEDYTESKWPICGVDYYSKAVSKLAAMDSRLIVFSDDIEKAKGVLESFDCVFVEHCTPAEQLYLMSRCDDFIISNSTFSWWGAFLGHKEDRRIICPSYWHTCPTCEVNVYYNNMEMLELDKQ